MIYVYCCLIGTFGFLFFLTDSEDWGGMCAAGKRQSPVDLAHDAAIKGEYPGLIFQNFDSAMKSPQIVNNGHSSKWQSPDFITVFITRTV